jgi:hypothetical protein
MNNKQRFVIGVGSLAVSFAMLTSVALAAGNPSGTGQPSQSCQEQTTMPNGFSTGGFTHAALVYAGSEGTPSFLNGNAHAVSQYDVACYQLSNN